MDAKSKGNELEEAVAWIEESIAAKAQSPGMPIREIIPNWKDTLDDVPCEIDLWVREKHDIPPDLIYIFECKNWKKPIGPAELSYFIRKIEASEASHGFFVAPKFTKGAYALAKRTPRLSLLKVDRNPTESLLRISAKFYQATISRLGIYVIYKNPKVQNPQEHLHGEARIDGNIVDLAKYCNDLARELLDREIQREKHYTELIGKHKCSIKQEFECNSNGFTLNKHEVAHFILTGEALINTQRFKLLRHYDIEQRGYISDYGGLNIEGCENITLRVGKTIG